MTNPTSRCHSCASTNLVELNAEICLKFPGLKGLCAEPIFVFPKVVACFACGSMQSNFSAEDLWTIRENAIRVKRASA